MRGRLALMGIMLGVLIVFGVMRAAPEGTPGPAALPALATVTSQPNVALTLGAPQAAFDAAWRARPDIGSGYYGTCPDNAAAFQWYVSYDAGHRATLITPKACTSTPLPLDWHEGAQAYLPADAVEVKEAPESGGTILAHYTSAVLGRELGSPDISVRGTPATNQWSAFTGYAP